MSLRRILLVFLLLAANLAATEPDLSGPLRIELRDGRTYSGQPSAFRNDRLYLKTRIGAGEVEQGFPRVEIARLYFPGESVAAEAANLLADGNSVAALPLLEALWRQRAPWLVLLEIDDRELLSALPTAYFDNYDFYGAIAFANRILPHIEAPEIRARLNEAILLSHLKLGMHSETSDLAKTWILAQKSPPDSALGWRVLAELALLDENPDQLLWIALQPIAFSSPLPVPHLNHCYALAIHACHSLENPEQAAQLFSEMRDLKLPWPDDDRFHKTRNFYQNLLQQKPPAEEIAAAPEADLNLRPPKQDLNIPLQNVRKLLSPAQP